MSTQKKKTQSKFIQKAITTLGLGMAIGCMSPAVYAAEAEASKSDQQEVNASGVGSESVQNKAELVKQNFMARHPTMPAPTGIEETGIKGLWQVIVGGSEVIYTNEDVSLLILGQMFQLKDGEQPLNLTEKALDKATSMDFSKLDTKYAIIKKIGDGSRKMVTFEDPECHFCIKLHKELDKLDNVTIITYPIAILGNKSRESLEHIWCSDNKEEAWYSYLKTRKLNKLSKDKLASCDKEAFSSNYNFAASSGVNGTPAIFFENGKRLRGYAGADVIKKMLDGE